VALPSGTVTFLFTDIEGSTRLWDNFPDDMRRALALHDDLVAGSVADHKGVVVKNTGDGMFAVFDSPLAAVLAAVTAATSLGRADWPAVVGALGVRMALHTATIEPQDGDYHGPEVNRVARIEAAGHGGQVLLSDTTHALVYRSLPDELTTQPLGTHLLRGLSTPERIHQVMIPDLPSSFPPLRTLTTTTAKLPEFATPFIGRTAEITSLARQVADPARRMLTLVGHGGAGKTRLAVEVARRCAEEGRVVAHFVSLVPVSTVDGMVKTLADSLDFTIDFHTLSSSFTEKRQVLDRLAMYPMVLVLDNFEHLLESAGFVQEILTEAPDTTVIVTSRERLGLQSEWIHEVGGFSSEDNDAPALLMDRARQAGGTLDEDDPNIDRICDLVGRYPLGIELAAAWTPMLSTRQIADEISKNLDFLEATARDIPERHRSLRAVFDYSWNLLDDAGREALASLGVFPSSFTREASSAVAGTSLSTLFDLLKKSLVQRSGIDRFDLHPLVRDFALEKLGDRRAALEEQHAHHYADFLLARSSDLEGSSNQVAVRDEVAAEWDHVRTAAEWHHQHSDAEVCLPILDALVYFLFLYSWTDGADEFVRLSQVRADRSVAGSPLDDVAYLQARLYHHEFALNFTEPAPATEELLTLMPACERVGGHTLAWCLTDLGVAACIAGEIDAALDWFSRAESLAVKRDDLLSASLFAWYGWTKLLAGDVEGGRSIFAAAEEQLHADGAELGRAYLLSKLGVAADELGDHAAAAEYHGRAQDVFVKFNDPSGQGYALSRLSWTWFSQGDYELSIRYALEALEHFESVNHRWGSVISRCRAALPEIELGRIDSALERLYEALDMADRSGMREATLYALTGIGRAWAAAGRDEDAALLLSFCDRDDSPYQSFVEPKLGMVSQRLGDAAVEPIRARAAAMDLDDAMRFTRSHQS